MLTVTLDIHSGSLHARLGRPLAQFGTLTLLFNQSVAGLQILHPHTNTWHFVRPQSDGGIVVNVGDALQAFTAGYLRSSWHRVVAPPEELGQEGETRWSLVYFVGLRRRDGFLFALTRSVVPPAGRRPAVSAQGTVGKDCGARADVQRPAGAGGRGGASPHLWGVDGEEGDGGSTADRGRIRTYGSFRTVDHTTEYVQTGDEQDGGELGGAR